MHVPFLSIKQRIENRDYFFLGGGGLHCQSLGTAIPSLMLLILDKQISGDIYFLQRMRHQTGRGWGALNIHCLLQNFTARRLFV